MVKDVLYSFEMQDKDGNRVPMWGYGIDKITDPVPPLDMSGIRPLFPHVPEEVFRPLPAKPLDILVGMNFFGLHPDGGTGLDRVKNLKALRSKFSMGWVIAGSHSDLRPPSVSLTAQAKALATMCRVEVEPHLLKSFWEADGLGVEPQKRRGRCIKCKECSEEGLILSCKEEDELRMIQQSIKLEDGRIKCKYPFIKDPGVLSFNRAQVLKMAERQEARLLK